MTSEDHSDGNEDSYPGFEPHQIYFFDAGPEILQKSLDSKSVKILQNGVPFNINRDNWGVELDEQCQFGGIIQGTVHFHLPQIRGVPIEFSNLMLIFEGMSETKFSSDDTKGRPAIISKTHLYFDSAGKTNSTNHYHFIRDGKRKNRTFRPGGRRTLHSFHFKILLDQLDLASSFQSSFGQVGYVLILFGTLTWRLRTYMLVAEKKIYTRGYLSPSRYLRSAKKFVEIVKPTLSDGRGILTARMRLESGILTAGEKLEFEFKLDNPSYEFIGKLNVFVVQKINYFVDHLQNKCVKKVLMKVDNFCGRRMRNIQWKGEFQMPGNLVHSWEGEEAKSIQVSYAIQEFQFTVEIRGRVWLEGKIPIVVATRRGVNGPTFYFKNEPFKFPGGTDIAMAWLESSSMTPWSLPVSRSWSGGEILDNRHP